MLCKLKWWTSFLYLRTCLSLRKQRTFGEATTGFPPNDVWETSAEIPYWWRVTASDWSCGVRNFIQPIRSTTEIWVVTYRIISMEFLRSFLTPVVATLNVGCFLRLYLSCRFLMKLMLWLIITLHLWPSTLNFMPVGFIDLIHNKFYFFRYFLRTRLKRFSLNSFVGLTSFYSKT